MGKIYPANFTGKFGRNNVSFFYYNFLQLDLITKLLIGLSSSMSSIPKENIKF